MQVNYGLNGNFFVRSYDEISGPANKKYFYKKNFLGTIGGVELTYKISKKSSLFVGYNKSINNGKKNYGGTMNGVDIFIHDFKLRHTNNFFQLGLAKQLGQKENFKVSAGTVLVYDAQQTINIENWENYILINESTYKNANSVEGGVFLGIEYLKKIDSKFDLGVACKGYYLISVNTIEAITFSPTLTYHF